MSVHILYSMTFTFIWIENQDKYIHYYIGGYSYWKQPDDIRIQVAYIGL